MCMRVYLQTIKMNSALLVYFCLSLLSRLSFHFIGMIQTRLHRYVVVIRIFYFWLFFLILNRIRNRLRSFRSNLCLAGR